MALLIVATGERPFYTATLRKIEGES
jgi:hypothetical protein